MLAGDFVKLCKIHSFKNIKIIGFIKKFVKKYFLSTSLVMLKIAKSE